MKSEVASPFRMEDSPVLITCVINRVDSFHTAIHTKNEIVEVQSQADSVGYSDLLVEVLELKLTSRLVGIVAQRPDITCIYEECALEFPKQLAEKKEG